MLFCNLITSLFLLIMQFRVYPRYVLDSSSSCCPLSWSGPQLGFHVSMFSQLWLKLHPPKSKTPKKKIEKNILNTKLGGKLLFYFFAGYYTVKIRDPCQFPNQFWATLQKMKQSCIPIPIFCYKSREASDLWSFTSVHRAGLMSFCQLNAQPGQFIFWTSPVGERGIATPSFCTDIMCV